MKSVFGLAAAAVLLGGALNAGAVIDLILAQPPVVRLRSALSTTARPDTWLVPAGE